MQADLFLDYKLRRYSVMNDNKTTPAIYAENISKYFGAVTRVKIVSFTIEQG